MAMDNRLDFISNIDLGMIEKMKEVRKEFISLDERIKEIAETSEEFNVPSAIRSASVARTHLESALMYTIKSMCLLGEIEG